MDKTVLQQEIEGAIDGGRRRNPPTPAQRMENCISANRFVSAPYELQDSAPQCRKPHPTALTKRRHPLNRSLDAGIMVMAAAGKGPGALR